MPSYRGWWADLWNTNTKDGNASSGTGSSRSSRDGSSRGDDTTDSSTRGVTRSSINNTINNYDDQFNRTTDPKINPFGWKNKTTLENLLSGALSSGKWDADSPDFKWMFNLLWERQNADYQQSLSKDMAMFNQQLGLDTSYKSRSQLYNQLIAAGMSPAAAMQAIAGLTGSGGGSSSGGSAGSVGTSQGTPGIYGTDKANAAANVIGAVGNTASSLIASIGQLVQNKRALQQNNDQFMQNLSLQYDQMNSNYQLGLNQQDLQKQQLALQRDQFEWNKQFNEACYAWPIAVGNASRSKEMTAVENALRDAIVGENWSAEDQFSYSAILKKASQGAEGSLSANLYSAIQALQKEHGHAGRTALESCLGAFTRSISDENTAKLAFSQARNLEAAALLSEAMAAMEEFNVELISNNKDLWTKEQVQKLQYAYYSAKPEVDAMLKFFDDPLSIDQKGYYSTSLVSNNVDYGTYHDMFYQQLQRSYKLQNYLNVVEEFVAKYGADMTLKNPTWSMLKACLDFFGIRPEIKPIGTAANTYIWWSFAKAK